MTTTTQSVDRTDLEVKVKEVYQQVAQDPFGEFHFAMGRSLAEQLGYSPAAIRDLVAAGVTRVAANEHAVRQARA